MRAPFSTAAVPLALRSIVQIVRDPLPPVRADLLTLFGAEMPRHGLESALVGQAGAASQSSWRAGAMYIVGHFTSRFAGVLTPLWDGLGLVRAWRAATVRPACIQVRDKVASGVLARIAAAALGVPFVYWMSFPIVEGYAVRRDAIRRQGRVLAWLLHALRAAVARVVLYRLVLPGARHVFVQSDAMAAALRARGVAPSRMTAVPMGVDTALFDRRNIAPSTDPRLDGRRIVLYLGSIAQSRRSDFLLDVVAQLRTALPEVLLVIAGDAPSTDEMVWMRGEIARRALDDHVLLTGWLPRHAALGYAVRAEVGVSPIPRGALFDVSSPTKLVEYLALGIPCVGNDIPDQAQVLGDSRAGLCVPMEAGPFAAAVRRLLYAPQLAAACAARGPAWVGAHRSYAILGARVAHTYATILAHEAP
jgi:glycosyltransferase involved in cell wall biosynthesis